MRKYVIAILLLFSSVAFATTRYVASTAGSFSGGTACNGQTAITPTTWNGLTLSAGDITYICGTITGSAGATILTGHGSGSSGSPITLNFDTSAVIQAPYCNGTNGCIDVHGLSWWVVNGQSTGTVQNTANGDGLTYGQASIGIFAYPCNNCTFENLTIANMYVAIQNFSTPLGGTMTQINALYYSGQNGVITGMTIHDCGWCVYVPYGSGDTNLQVYNNDIYHWDHAMMFAAPSALSCTAPCLLFHDNRVHDNVNFETSGCVYHLDGIHFFGVSGSTMNGIYLYNNHWYGSLSGPCSSGFYFMEQGSPSQSNASNVYLWNDVLDASGADTVSGANNENGWVGIFGTIGGVLQVLNNTLICANSTDGSQVGYSLSENSNAANITFENNLSQYCPQGMNLRKGTGTLTMDYNQYGNACVITNNCFVWAGTTFEGTFSAWKTACSCDTHSGAPSAATLNLGTNGVPNTGSPALLAGPNLSTTATGSLATLQNSTTLGATIGSPEARPTGATAWDEGASEISNGGSTYTITVSSITGNGTVTSSDSVLNCTTGTTGTCTDSTASGTVTLTFTPSSGYTLSSVTGCTLSGNTCSVTTTATITATFVAIPPAPTPAILMSGNSKIFGSGVAQ